MTVITTGPVSSTSMATPVYVPEKEIEELINMHSSLSKTDIQQRYRSITSQLTKSLESIHLALFQIEQDVKDQFTVSLSELPVSDAQLIQLEESLNQQIIPSVNTTLSVNDNILSTLPDDNSNYAFIASKLGSDISSLQSYIACIRQLILHQSVTLSLHKDVEDLFIQMEAISNLMFDYQEKRTRSFSTALAPVIPTAAVSSSLSSICTSSISAASFYQSSISSSSYHGTPTTSVTPPLPNHILFDEETGNVTQKLISADDDNSINKEVDGIDDQQELVVTKIDSLFTSMAQSVESVHHRFTLHQRQEKQQQQQQQHTNHAKATISSSATMNLLERKYEKLKVKWDDIQGEREDLRATYKEERWLNIFRRVTDQVDVMMDGLNKSAVQCYSFIQHVRDWQETVLPPTPTSSTFESNHSKYGKAHNSPITMPVEYQRVDIEKFKSLVKSFEAKVKYYTPSIDRMLSMLHDGINARTTTTSSCQHRAIISKHESMLQRWQNIRNVMDDLRHRDIPEMERVLFSAVGATTSNSSVGSADQYIPPIPPATPTSIITKGGSNARNWKSIRYRTPTEPLFYLKDNTSSSHMARSGTPRSATPNSSIFDRLSPANSSQQQQQSHQYQNQPLQPSYDSVATKGSILSSNMSDTSSIDSSASRRLHKQQISRTAASPKPTRQLSTRLIHSSRSPRIVEDFYEEDERAFGIDISAMIQNQQHHICTKHRNKASTNGVAISTATIATNKRSHSSHTRHMNLTTAQQQAAAFRAKADLRSRSSIGHLSISSHQQSLPSFTSDHNGRSWRGLALPTQRRAMTPSLIPRPRTPKESMIPRPPSSTMTFHGRRSSSTSTSIIPHKKLPARADTNTVCIPPVPPLPKYVTLRQQQQQQQQQQERRRKMTNNNDDTFSSSSSSSNGSNSDYSSHYHYQPDSKDPLDKEIAKILNASPVTIECQRVGPTKHPGKYYFGNDAATVLDTVTGGVGKGVSRKKMYTCKLMTYENRGRRAVERVDRNNRQQQQQAKSNKVLVRVGGGWQDLEFFLLEHSS
ncbi:hypothetical protein BDF20DRAFT_583352 [Mycotypha africana]|uniref:uncharacterized protein n=1 Tax=Mycotypha africana TaxID=64632 RepID=UPI0023008E18|nr:uncharacterized protein BDF20DRAFT_583352 [Mycotypha africana]KAI8975039.1 hypothetical protein BDF20DRAFT_583352 [Mycotypha africana]